MALKLMYITNRLDVALIAEKNGVDRIWIDLETLGKEERQKGMNTVKSQHSIDDIKRIKPFLSASEMLVRINPWNKNSEQEINAVIDAGADIIMLPMWKSASEVASFLKAVNGRCKTTLLLETKEAVECLDEVLQNGGMDEIHIGLNDLHLSYGLTFMFELLADGTVEKLIKKIKIKEIPCGFGGIARLGEGELPAEKIIMEHYRLGSTRAILSRSFCNTEIVTKTSDIERIFQKNMKELRDYEKTLVGEKDFKANQDAVKAVVARVVAAKKGCK
nr:aldolase/citrate lyase family protein [uncultured Blautia sp.]